MKFDPVIHQPTILPRILISTFRSLFSLSLPHNIHFLLKFCVRFALLCLINYEKEIWWLKIF